MTTNGQVASTFGYYFVFIAIAIASGAAMADTGYKCVADDGRVEYRELTVQGMKCTPLRPPPPASVDPAAEMEKLRQQANPAPTDSAQAQTEAEQKQQNCERAKRNQAILESETDVVRTDADGNKVVLDGEQRQAALAQTKKDVEYWCN